MAARMGAPLFPWQQYVADVALEVDEAGNWAYDEVFVTAPRRSGKTHLIVPVTAHRLGQPGRKAMSWITAQTLKSAVRRWEEIADKVVNSPLRAQVKKNRGNPQELRWRSTGSVFAPFAPNEEAMHGEDPDLVWVDELWAFDLEQKRVIEQGYRPAWSVRSGQAWEMSTAGTPRSEWFNETRRRAREAVEAGVVRKLAGFDWSAPERVDGRPIEQLDDAELLRAVLDSHPRRDHGVRPEFLAGELDDRTGMGRIEFLRAYGNLSQNEDSVGSQAVFSSDQMKANRGGVIPDGVRIGLGVAVDDDRRDAAIAVAWRGLDGRCLTSYRRAEGTRWVAGDVLRLVEKHGDRVGPVAVQSAGPARDVADTLELAGVAVLRVSQADTAAAGSRFHDEFVAGTIGWDGSIDFSAAVAAAEPHKVQSGIVWRSRTGAPVSTLNAGTVAVWGVDHAEQPVKPLPDFKVW